MENKVKEGEWIYIYTDLSGNKVCDCSICRYRFKPAGYNFCPHCGAKMEMNINKESNITLNG